MQLQGIVGPQVVSDGSATAPRMGRTAELIMTELHGKYFEQNLRGNVFTCTPTAGVLTLGTATTVSTTLVNPPGGGKLLSLIRIEVAITALPGTPVVGTYGVYVQSNPLATAPIATAATIQSSLIGSAFKSQGQVYTAATVTAGVLFRNIANKETGASTTIPYLPTFSIDFDGTLILQPGTSITVGQNTGDTTNATAAITYIWEEI